MAIPVDPEEKARAEKREVWGRVAFGIGSITGVIMMIGCLISFAGLPNPCCFAGCLGAPAAFVTAYIGFNTESRSEAIIGMVLGAVSGLTSLLGIALIIAAIAGMVDVDEFLMLLD